MFHLVPPRERAQLRPVKRLSAAAHAEPHHEPCHQRGPVPLPVDHEQIEHISLLLPAARADHLRALADQEHTIAADLVRQWVCERLDELDVPSDPFDGQSYPSNVIRLPFVR